MDLLAPEPCSLVGTTVLRLELEGICYSQAAPLLPGSSVLGQGYSLHIPEWVRTSPCFTLPHLPCCVLGAGDPALLPCWGPAHDNPPVTPQTAAVASCPSCIPGVSVPRAPHPAGPLLPWGWQHPQPGVAQPWAGSVC